MPRHRHAPLASAPLREARRGFNADHRRLLARRAARVIRARLVPRSIAGRRSDQPASSACRCCTRPRSPAPVCCFDAEGSRLPAGSRSCWPSSMTPVWTWAILRLTGALPNPNDWDNALSRYEPYIATRIIVARAGDDRRGAGGGAAGELLRARRADRRRVRRAAPPPRAGVRRPAPRVVRRRLLRLRRRAARRWPSPTPSTGASRAGRTSRSGSTSRAW